GGNATGFMNYEYSLSGKWLELLKQIAPSVKRAAVLRNPDVPSGPVIFGAIQTVAGPRGGGGPRQYARCRRDRTRHRGLRSLGEWRPDHSTERISVGSSRSDHHAGGPKQAARGLSLPLHAYRWRPNLLRA